MRFELGWHIILPQLMRRVRSRTLAQSTAMTLLAVCLAGCSGLSSLGGSSNQGNQIVPPPPEPTSLPGQAPTPGAGGLSTAPASGASAAPQAMDSATLYVAYRDLLDNYVDPISDTQLLTAAQGALQKDLLSQPRLPMLSLPAQLLPQPAGNADQDWSAFAQAYDAVVAKNPDWAQSDHPDWLVLKSMADSLKDDHTLFLTPDETARATSTTFAGIGVLLAKSQEGKAPLVEDVYPNTPAAQAGLKRGDHILQVDGKDVSQANVSDVAQLIRGPQGQSVQLLLQRYGQQQPVTVKVTRAQVQIDPAIGQYVRTLPGVAYLKIRNFSTGSANVALQIMAQGMQNGATSWVVDLRGNGGGSVQEVLRVAGALLPASDPTVGYAVDRGRTQTPLQAIPSGNQPPQTIVVLVDGDTASGAEILAAALQDHGATLVGSKTSGNVAVAAQQGMPDGSTIQITEQRYLSPKGTPLDGVGVTPQVAVPMTDSDVEASKDPQLSAALQQMENLLQASGAAASPTPGAQ